MLISLSWKVWINPRKTKSFCQIKSSAHSDSCRISLNIYWHYTSFLIWYASFKNKIKITGETETTLWWVEWEQHYAKRILWRNKYIFRPEKSLSFVPKNRWSLHIVTQVDILFARYKGCGVGVGIVKSRSFSGGVGVGFLATLGVGVGYFCPTPTPEVQLDHFLHHTLKLGIPVEIVQFILKLLLKQRFLAVLHDFHWF